MRLIYTLLLALLLAACQPATAAPQPPINMTALLDPAAILTTAPEQFVEPAVTITPIVSSIFLIPPRVCDETAQPLEIRKGEFYTGNVVIDIILQDEEVARLFSVAVGTHLIAGGMLNDETLLSVQNGVAVMLYPMADAQCALDYIIFRMNAGAQLSSWDVLTKPAYGQTEPFVTFTKK